MSTFTLEEIIRRTTDLPVLPEATVAVIQETNKQDVSAQSVAAHIIRDPGLSSRMLRLANSAFYGLSRQINTIPDAVTILGLRTVRNLALVASTYTWMSKPIKGYALEPQDMWRHALGTAAASQIVAEHTHKAPGDVAFCAGLLHDLGKLALSVWFEGRLKSMIQLAETTGLPFDGVERQLLGFDHADVGAALAKKWNLPHIFELTAQYHHRPDDCESGDPIVDAVHIGDYLAMSMGIGLGGDGLIYELSDGALLRMGISCSDLERLTDKVLPAFEKYGLMFKEMVA